MFRNLKPEFRLMWIILFSLAGTFFCGAPRSTELQECSPKHFPGSFTGGCLDTNLNGQCDIGGDISLTSDGQLSAFNGDEPSRQGYWVRSGSAVVMLFQIGGCQTSGFYGSCKACATKPVLTEEWRLTYADGFFLHQKDSPAMPVRCLIP